MHFTTTLLAAILSVTALAAPASLVPRASNKRGICYNDAKLTKLFTPSSHWAYNWADGPSVNTNGQLANGLQYVPMLYSGNVGNFKQQVEKALRSGSKHILGFNEPDQPRGAGGSEMPDAGRAAQIYRNNVTPFSGRARLGAPAVSAGGLDWLRRFAAACNRQCKIDFVPLHFYDYTHKGDAQTQFQSLKGWLQGTIPQVRQMFGNPNLEIWLTEFAYVDSNNGFGDAQGAKRYMDLALPFLENNNNIARYSYFMAGENNMVKGGKLSASGKRYN